MIVLAIGMKWELLEVQQLLVSIYVLNCTRHADMGNIAPLSLTS